MRPGTPVELVGRVAPTVHLWSHRNDGVDYCVFCGMETLYPTAVGACPGLQGYAARSARRHRR